MNNISKKRIYEIFTHPAFLSLVVSLIIIIVLPYRFPKYRIIHIKDQFTPQNTLLFYNDLDSDGSSEEISLDLIDKKQTKILIRKDNKVLNQYDLRFQPYFYPTPFFGDYNNDGNKEIYVFTVSEDSIFLNIIDPVVLKKTIITDRLIDVWKKPVNSDDAPSVFFQGMLKNSRNNSMDLVFFINAGYSLQPRKYYRYLVSEDSLVKSPDSGIALTESLIDDINNDGFPEFLLTTLSTGNLPDSGFYSDKFTWLMVLDRNLRFLFPPKNLGSFPARLQTIPLVFGKEKKIMAFINYFGSDSVKTGFHIYNPDGKEYMSKAINDFVPESSRIFAGENEIYDHFFFMKDRESNIYEMDTTLKIIKSRKIPGISTSEPQYIFDIDHDGKSEYMFLGENQSSHIIVKNNFTFPVIWNHQFSNITPLLSLYKQKGSKSMLYGQFKGVGVFIRYERNPFYYFRFPLYILLFISVLLFISLISRAQKYRLNIRNEREKELVGLQLKAIRNQIDPHFTLNVLNAIGSLYADEKMKDKADYIFAKYAKLIRETVLTSDKVIVTIGEELDFVRNYIEIERFRSDNSFNYNITIEEGSDLQRTIPRMLIHTFIENAIKYGIRRNPENSFLNIKLQMKGKIQTIVIENNGEFARPGSQLPGINGTGKGLIILNELIALFRKLENIKISYDINSESDKNSGSPITRAVIRIPGN